MMTMTLKEQIEAAGFEYVNGLINERNFPARQAREGAMHIQVPNDMTLRQAKAWAEGEGFEMASVYELIGYPRTQGHVYALADVVETDQARVPLTSLENGVLSLSMGFYDGALSGDDYLLVFKRNDDGNENEG